VGGFRVGALRRLQHGIRGSARRKHVGGRQRLGEAVVLDPAVARLLPEVAAVARNQWGLAGRHRASLAHWCGHGLIGPFKKRQRVGVRANGQVVIHQIEHAVGIGPQVSPQPLILLPQQRALVAQQAATGIGAEPVQRSCAGLCVPVEPTK